MASAFSCPRLVALGLAPRHLTLAEALELKAPKSALEAFVRERGGGAR